MKMNTANNMALFAIIASIAIAFVAAVAAVGFSGGPSHEAVAPGFKAAQSSAQLDAAPVVK